ncbi:MAG TPA: hypothetical protein VGD79_11555, partial [Thermoanaerobaculia bacterium]
MKRRKRTLLGTLRDPAFWEAIDAPHPPASRVMADVQRFLDEKESAAALLDGIVAKPRAWWPQHLRKTHGAMTPGMVHELLRRMMLIVKQSPEDALQLTTMAIEVSDALDAEDYPSGMVSRA